MGATEIVVHISTNACPSLHYTDIFVDGQHVTQAPTPACDPTNPLAVVDIGTITVLPSKGLDSNVNIALVGNVGTEACASPDTTDPQCIVARRAITFNPHQRIDLPILLDNACAGLQCPADQTCVVDDTGAHCGSSTCGNGDAPACVVDAGGGGGDAIATDVISFDVTTPTCKPVFPGGGTPTFSWSFDTVASDNLLHEDTDAFKEPFTGASTTSAPPSFCDNPYLDSTVAQDLAATGNNSLFQKFATASFVVGLAFYTASSDVTLLSLAGSTSQTAGFAISLVSNTLSVSFGGAAVYSSPTYVKPSVWHRFALEVTTSTGGGANAATIIMPYFDGVPGTPVPATRTYTIGAPIAFTVGPIDADNVVFYAK